MLLNGELVDPVDLRLRLDLITTTSPSALIYGGIDGFLRRMVRGKSSCSPMHWTGPTGCGDAWVGWPGCT
jgi:hypothetical protein